MVKLSDGPHKKERTKRYEHVGILKSVNLTIVSTSLLMGLDVKFYEIVARQLVH